jgi:hypothetical protein
MRAKREKVPAERSVSASDRQVPQHQGCVS